MSDAEKIVALWNAQADEFNYWENLDEEEKIEFTIKAAKLEALDMVNDAFSNMHGEDKITVCHVWDEVIKLKQQIESE